MSVSLLLPLLFAMSTIAVAHDLTKVNFSYLYNHDPVKINYQIAKQDSLYKLVLSFHLVKVQPTDQLANLILYRQKKINSIKEYKIMPTVVKMDSGFVKNIIEMDFYMTQSDGYLVLEFSFLKKPYLFGIPINESLPFPTSNILCKTDAKTIFYDGFKKNDSVWFESAGTPASQYFVFQYKENFPPAQPPMVEKGIIPVNKLMGEVMDPVEKGLTLNQGSYLYFFQKDSTSNIGTSLLCHKEYYPRIKEVGELIESLIYICPSEEYEELNEAENKKKAFNEFWLNHIKDKRLATKTIKKYFRSVKFANALFSDYKNGWKTDRGMIYIAFGPPEQVTRKEEKEIWEYKTYAGGLKFTFAKTPNLFVQQHYTLVRQKAMNKAWFQAVKKWRTGDL